MPRFLILRVVLKAAAFDIAGSIFILTQMDGKGSPLHRGSVEVSIVHMQVPSAHRL